MDTKLKSTHKSNIQLFQAIKEGQLIHQGKWFAKDQIQRKFPHLKQELDARGNIVPKEGQLI